MTDYGTGQAGTRRTIVKRSQDIRPARLTKKVAFYHQHPLVDVTDEEIAISSSVPRSLFSGAHEAELMRRIRSAG
jgi:hypothetical protein